MNLVLLLFNLVPAFPLDGGRIARAAAWKLTGDRHRATRFAARIGIGFGWLLIGLGLLLLVAFGSDAAFDAIWFAALGWLLASAARTTLAQTAFTEQLAGITVADVMDAEPVTIPAALPAGRAYEDYFLRYQGWEWFAVVEDDGRYTGLAHRRAVEHAALEEGGAAPMRDVAAPRAAVTDFLEEKRKEIQARLKELKPLVDEYRRLEAAERALAGVGGQAGAAARRAPRHARAAVAATGAAGGPRARGTRAKQALELVRARPGITIPELAEAMGIKQNYLYRVMPDARRAGPGHQVGPRVALTRQG